MVSARAWSQVKLYMLLPPVSINIASSQSINTCAQYFSCHHFKEHPAACSMGTSSPLSINVNSPGPEQRKGRAGQGVVIWFMEAFTGDQGAGGWEGLDRLRSDDREQARRPNNLLIHSLPKPGRCRVLLPNSRAITVPRVYFDLRLD